MLGRNKKESWEVRATDETYFQSAKEGEGEKLASQQKKKKTNRTRQAIGIKNRPPEAG